MSALRELLIPLRTARLRVGTEAQLQADIGAALTSLGISFEAEARLSQRDRIDFLTAEGIGIEAKVKYPKRAIFRQLARYAEHDQIKALVLITATALGLPPEISGKPVYFISLGRASL